MLHSEIVSSLQEGVKINVLVFDNRGFQCIKDLQMSQGSQAGFGNELRYRSSETGKLDADYLEIDFAGIARSLGAKAYTARTPEELQEALQKAKEETVSTLIDIKVVPGTHSHGYESWWRVGVSEVSENEGVREAYAKHQEYLSEKIREW